MRGDPPSSGRLSIGVPVSTPHARGSTSLHSKTTYPATVYPACAGIHLTNNEQDLYSQCLPRMRGDPPRVPGNSDNVFESTPHARGSTRVPACVCPSSKVYPACAGIHRNTQTPFPLAKGLPRMRGDPPSSGNPNGGDPGSTPHARGSTRVPACVCPSSKVYPACAGIHPLHGCQCWKWRCLPRMRGDPPW